MHAERQFHSREKVKKMKASRNPSQWSSNSFLQTCHFLRRRRRRSPITKQSFDWFRLYSLSLSLMCCWIMYEHIYMHESIICIHISTVHSLSVCLFFTIYNVLVLFDEILYEYFFLIINTVRVLEYWFVMSFCFACVQ